jgi:hypothetical protein
VLHEKVDANETIRATQVELGLAAHERLPFLCECHDRSCRGVVRLTAAEYGEVRAGAGRFIVLDGHPYDGRILREGDGYAVIEE